jgi:hypothetical protein
MDPLNHILETGVAGDTDLPAILLGIVVAYLTILITVAIAIFGDRSKEYETLDRNVILDYVIKVKSLSVYLGLAFFPLLFWNNSLTWTRLLEMILWAVGVGFMTRILFHSYHWMKGNKYRLRFGYLRDLRNTQDTEEAWRSVWQTEKINYQNEQEFFKIFYSSCNRYLVDASKDNLIIASKLLGDFNNFLDNRSSLFLIRMDGMFANILEWHFKLWKNEHEYLGQEGKIEEWGLYGDLSRTLNSIFRQIETRALKERDSFLFIRRLEKHTNEYKKEVVSSRYYIESLFRTFYQVLFQNISEAPDRFDIWEHYFPKEWKITLSNLQKSENLVSRISLKNFFEWADGRFLQASKEKDFSLNDVVNNLFPEVDPILWSRILTFVMSSYGENRVRSVIERPWNIGFVGRVKILSGFQEDELSRSYEIDEINTFELAYFLFKKEFTTRNLEDYIKSLEQLSYPQESPEADKRDELLHLFTKMLAFVRNKDQSSSKPPADTAPQIDQDNQ